MSPRRTPGSAVLILLLLLAVPAASQEPERAELERLARLARTASPVVRPQAARRLVGHGAAAVPVVRALAGPDGRGLAALGRDLVEVLGGLEDPELRAWLWAALDDPAFPWRPSAARTLAESTRDGRGEGPRFEARLEDRSAAVRVAACRGLEALERRAAIPELRARLSDPHPRVRRTAAAILASFGERDALAWLVEELRRDDSWFGREEGREGRAAAARELTRALGPLAGFDANRPPSWPPNRAAWLRARQRVKAAAGGWPELPAVALAGRPTPGDVLGLELSSCRVGEVRLRWNTGDRLHVGRGRAAEVVLPEGTVAALLEAAGDAVDALGGRTLFGEPGCDTEELSLRPSPEAKLRVVRVSKGPEAVKGLRPPALDRLFVRLLASIPDVAGDDPRLHDLRNRTRRALEAIGGPFP